MNSSQNKYIYSHDKQVSNFRIQSWKKYYEYWNFEDVNDFAKHVAEGHFALGSSQVKLSRK